MIRLRATFALSLSLLSSAVYAAETAKPAAAKAPSTSATKTTVVNKDEQIVKVGCVNTLEAMQASKEGQEEAKRIEKYRQDLATTIQDKEKKLNHAVNDFKAKQTTLSVAAREKEESKILEMRRDLESTVQSSEDQLKLAMQRATEKLSQNIEAAVAQIAQAQGLDLVTDIYTGRPLHASDKMLLTNDLIHVMDANHAKGQPKSAPAAAPAKATKAA